MSKEQSIVNAPVAVLGWAVPRPTGRWHQSVVVTNSHVWITPELSYAENERMVATSELSVDAFHDYVRAAAWQDRSERCTLKSLRGLNWNERTGLLRFAHGDDQIMSVIIPNRDAGTAIVPVLQQVFSARKAAADPNR